MKCNVLRRLPAYLISIRNHIGSGLVDIYEQVYCTYMNVHCNIHNKHTAYTGESMILLYKNFVDIQNIYVHIHMHILKLIQLIHSSIPMFTQLPMKYLSRKWC